MPTQRVDGADLHYERQGSGPPLVLVHGSWVDAMAWLFVAPTLAERFDVVTYDRRGHGQSTVPSGQGYRSQDEDDLVALIDALDMAPANVAGNSFGTSTVLGAAARRPEAFTRIAGHEPPLLRLASAAAPDLVDEQRRLLSKVYSYLEDGRDSEGAQFFVDNVAFAPGAWEQLPEPVKETFVKHAQTFLDEELEPGWDDLDLDSLAAFPGRILLSQGDQSFPWFWKVIDNIAQHVPKVERSTMAEAGHVPHMTHPAELSAMLTAYFLD